MTKFNMRPRCRLCLVLIRKRKVENIFTYVLNNSKDSFVHVLFQVFAVEIDATDKFEKHVCRKCVKIVEFVLSVKNKFQVCQEDLRKSIITDRKKESPADKIKDVSEYHQNGEHSSEKTSHVRASLENLDPMCQVSVQLTRSENSSDYMTYRNSSNGAYEPRKFKKFKTDDNPKRDICSLDEHKVEFYNTSEDIGKNTDQPLNTCDSKNNEYIDIDNITRDICSLDEHKVEFYNTSEDIAKNTDQSLNTCDCKNNECIDIDNIMRDNCSLDEHNKVEFYNTSEDIAKNTDQSLNTCDCKNNECIDIDNIMRDICSLDEHNKVEFYNTSEDIAKNTDQSLNTCDCKNNECIDIDNIMIDICSLDEHNKVEFYNTSEDIARNTDQPLNTCDSKNNECIDIDNITNIIDVTENGLELERNVSTNRLNWRGTGVDEIQKHRNFPQPEVVLERVEYLIKRENYEEVGENCYCIKRQRLNTESNNFYERNIDPSVCDVVKVRIVYVCCFCSKSFYSKSTLNSHCRWKHRSDICKARNEELLERVKTRRSQRLKTKITISQEQIPSFNIDSVKNESGCS